MNQFKLIILIAVAMAVAAFTLFKGENTSTDRVTAINSIPKLLDRNKDLQSGAEWIDRQNIYVANRDKIVDKDDPMAHYKLAALFVSEARITGEHGHYYPAALEIIEKLLQQKDLDKDLKFSALVLKSGILLSLHQFDKALVISKKTIEINDYNAQAYGVLADAYVEMGDYENAIKATERMMDVRPDLRSYSRVSYLREIHGDPKGAIEIMQLAVQSGYPGQEETAWAQLALGDLYRLYGKSENALATYEDILTHRENYPFATAAIAQLKSDEGKYTEAIQLLEEAIAVIPEIGFYIQLAEIYKVQGESEKFEQIMTDIDEMFEDDRKSGHNMDLDYAKTLLSLTDRADEAKKYLDNEYQMRPRNIEVNIAMAKYYQKTGDPQKAKQHLEVASRTKYQHPDLINLQTINGQ